MGTVQVILSQDVHALGDAGDIVSGKPGFARNYLIPQGKAIIATAERVNEVEHQKRVINEKLAKELSDLNAVKAKLHDMKLETMAQAGEGGKLFGSVTAANLAELIAGKGLESTFSTPIATHCWRRGVIQKACLVNSWNEPSGARKPRSSRNLAVSGSTSGSSSATAG